LVLLDPTAIYDVDDNALVVYPNPTTGWVTIAAEGVRRVEVFNVNGQLTRLVYDSSAIDLSELPAGVYTLRVVTNQGRMIGRVVKR
jgi:hypothetical protein